MQSGKLEWTFMHEDVPLENKIITTVDQLPSCPRKTIISTTIPLAWVESIMEGHTWSIRSWLKLYVFIGYVKFCLGSQCPELKLLNGQTQCTDENYYKSECRFVCNEGFVLDGATSTTCRGVVKPDWDTKKPACSKLSLRVFPSFGTVEWSTKNIAFRQGYKNHFSEPKIS